MQHAQCQPIPHDCSSHTGKAIPRRQLTNASWIIVAPIGVIVLVALALRLWAITWGLPYADHPDEQVLAYVALGMLRRGDWYPVRFDYPSLYFYALRLVFAAHWYVGLATGQYTSVADIPTARQVYLPAPGFYIWGRALTATLGAATVALLATVGWRQWGRSVALAAAAILAVLPLHIRHSQYLTVDVAGTLLVLLAISAALRLLEHTDRWSYALAGIAVGLAAATKYNDGAVLLAMLAAHTLHWGRASLRQGGWLVWAVLWALLGFVAATPYALLTPHAFVAGITAQYADYRGGQHGDVLGRWPLGAYLRFFWAIGLGPLLTLATLLGFGVVVARRDRAGLVVLAFILPYVLFFLAWPQHFWRNLLPIVPPLVLLAGIGLHAATAWLNRWSGSLHLRWWNSPEQRAPFLIRHLAMPMLMLLVIAMPLRDAIQLDRFDTQADARVRASAYVQDVLPHDAPIVVELATPLWHGDTTIIPVRSLTNHDLAWYWGQRVRYLVATGRARTRKDQVAYDYLRQHATLVRVFDDRLAAGQLGMATTLARSFASRPTRAWVEVLDLGAHLNVHQTTQLTDWYSSADSR